MHAISTMVSSSIALTITCYMAFGVHAGRIQTLDDDLLSSQLINSINVRHENKTLTGNNANSSFSNESITIDPNITKHSNDTFIGITLTDYNYFDFAKIGFHVFLSKLFEALKLFEFFLNLEPMVVKTTKAYVFPNSTIIDNTTKNHTDKSYHSNYSAEINQSLETNTESPFKAIPTRIPIRTGKEQQDLRVTEVKPTNKADIIQWEHANFHKKELKKNDKDKKYFTDINEKPEETNKELNMKLDQLTTNKTSDKEKETHKKKESRLQHTNYTTSITPKIFSEPKEPEKTDPKNYIKPKEAPKGFFGQTASAVMAVLKTIGSWFG